MKIFALYIKIKLTEKPEWFEEFLNKYFEPVSLHITLIQPRHIQDEQVAPLLSRVSEVLKKLNIKNEDKKVLFNNLEVEGGSDSEYTFMLHSHENNFLTTIQKELEVLVRDSYPLVKESHRAYEINFRPHLTIAADLSQSQKQEAEKCFTHEYRLEGTLDELVLPIVKDQSMEERTNPGNLNTFKL